MTLPANKIETISMILGVRQRIYHEATDFDAIVAVESVLGVLGFIDYFEVDM